LDRERAAGSRIIYVADNHAPDDQEFRMFPPHCIAGTAEAEVVPELAPKPGDVVIPKTRYSGFYGTDLERRLESLRPDKVIVCGVCTDICVMHTVADARNRDYAVEVPADCVASFDPEAHRWALAHMEKVLGAHVLPGTD
jgi:nicotinamidase-related amidase